MTWPHIIALALALADPAEDEADVPTVTLLPLRLEGAGKGATRERLDDAARKGLARHRVRVVEPPEAPGKPCLDDGCFRALGERAEADLLVVARVRVEGRDYGLHLEIRDGHTGGKVEAAERSCELCGVDEVAELLEDEVALLVDRGLSHELDQPVLVVRSEPPGAQIFVDGKARGRAPQELEVAAGVHRIRLEHPGYNPVEQEVRLAPGMRTRTRLSLVPRSTRPRKGAKAGGGALVGAGILGLGGGLAMLALDGRPDRARCTGGNVDADGDCRFVYRTMWGGAATLGVGVAALTAGIAWLLWDRTRGSHDSKGPARARLGVGGAAGAGATASGRF